MLFTQCIIDMREVSEVSIDRITSIEDIVQIKEKWATWRDKESSAYLTSVVYQAQIEVYSSLHTHTAYILILKTEAHLVVSRRGERSAYSRSEGWLLT